MLGTLLIEEKAMNFINIEHQYNRNEYLKFFVDKAINNFSETKLSPLREQYMLYLKTAQQKPEFSLLSTLEVFLQFLQDDPALLVQVLSDYQQMTDLGIENPFYINYWLLKNK